MLRLAQVPDAVTYTALIDACGRAGMLDQAFALFARCAALEHIRACTSPTFLFLLAQCRACSLSCLTHTNRMQGARVEPNLITYNALIHACAQVGATDAAFQVWHQLRADGRTKPNVRTFTELIGACCKTGALDASFGLLYQVCGIHARIHRRMHSHPSLSPPFHTDGRRGSRALSCDL